MADPPSSVDVRPLDVYDVDASDPLSRLVVRAGMAEADVRQVGRVMAALAALREAEQRLAEASQRYMKLNRNDMRALHYLIAAKNRGVIATPGAIAEHLGISTASTTKLLDRLERGGHVTREPHPTDRRALAIAITPETHEAAVATVGRQHAKRFHAAARLTREEREVVIRFLEEMTADIASGAEAWAQPEDRSGRP
mgnify:CR=1 FL=1